MLEKFDKKKEGSRLFYQDINENNAVAHRWGTYSGGSNIGTFNAHSTAGSVVSHPATWSIFFAEITNNKIQEGDTVDSGLYLGRMRYFDPKDREWKNRTKEWQIDASDTGQSLNVGDKLTVWWNQQRNMFIPCTVPTVIQIMLKTSIEPNGVADAFPLDDEGEIIDEERTIEVEDTIGDKRARGKDDVQGGEGDGAKGFVKLLTDGTWAIVELQCQAKLVMGTCEATDADATYTLTSITVLDDGQSPVDNNLEDVLNYSEDMGAGTAVCVHNGNGGYRTLDGPCA